MKRVLKWVQVNRITLSGFVALFFFVIESVFKVSEKLCLPSEWYYTVTAIIFVLIGFAINGSGLKGFKIVDQIMEEQRRLKNDEEILKQLDKIEDIVKDENEEEDVEKKDSS